MSTPIKILELKGKDFMSGISVQAGMSVGGLFSAAIGFDPFEVMGYLKSALYPIQLDATTITTKVRLLTTIATGGEGYVFGIADGTGAASKTLYRIKMSDSTVIDYSDKIDQNSTPGTMGHEGLTTYKGRIVYAQDGSLRSNSATPTTGNDTNILTSALTSLTGFNVAFGVGSDGILYYTAVGGGSIGKIVSVTSTAGNSATAFSFLPTTMIGKDICNDGIYTIFIADNNGAGGTAQTLLTQPICRIYFWDNIKSNADIIYDIPESYLISCRYVDGKVLILGSMGLWVCNSATPPKLIFPLTTSKLPSTAAQVTTQANILYWAGTAQGAGVFAYGAKVGKPILFNPWRNGSSSTNLHTALVASGTYFVTALDAGSSTPKVYLNNSGSTRSGASGYTTVTTLEQAYSFAFAKVVLKAPLTSGDSINLAIWNGNGSVIMDSTDKTFVQDGAKQTFIFQPKSTSSSFNKFEDLYLGITAVDDATVQRVSVYGFPINDNSQQI